MQSAGRAVATGPEVNPYKQISHRHRKHLWQSVAIVFLALAFALLFPAHNTHAQDGAEEGVGGKAGHECDDNPSLASCPAPPPTSLSISVNSSGGGDDLSIAYTRSTWSGSSSHRYRFELHRATSRSGTYSSYRSAWDGISPASFSNVARSYYYKARAKRCRTYSTSTCGDWSSWSGTQHVGTSTPAPPSTSSPPAPTSLRLSLSDDDFTLRYSRSSWSTSSYHYYVFQLHRATSSSGSYSRHASVNDGSSPAYFYNVTRDRYYKARGKRCTTSARTTCGSWSSWSSTVNVPAKPPPPTGLRLSLSDDDFTLRYSRSSWTASSSHYYVFEIHRATTSSGSYSRYRSANDTYSPTYFSNVTRDRYYKARGRRCTSSSRTSCGDWSSWSSTVRVHPLPGPPTGLRLSLSEDDFTLRYSRSSWSGSTQYYYVFELHRATSSSGSYSRHASANDASSPAYFSNVTRDRYYKARGKRCTNASRTTCGSWSAWSSTSRVHPLPGPPTNLRISATSDDIRLTYSRSTWSGSSSHYYVLELHRATSASGSFSRYSTGNDSSSPYDFDNVTRDRHYKARAKRCTTSSRTTCSGWSAWSSTIRVHPLPNPPSALSMSKSTDDLSLTYSRSSWSGSSSHYYEFELQRSATASGTYAKDETENDSRSPLTFSNVDRGYHYKARGRRCTDSARSDCGSWSALTATAIFVPRLPNPPSNLSFRRSTDDLTLTYSPSTWSDGTANYYQFNLRQATASSGSYSSYRTENDSASPITFSNVKRGRYYKAKGRRCTDSARTDCSAWSNETAGFLVPSLPDPPTGLTGTTDDDQLSVTYDRSTWSHGTAHYYEFEAHRSSTRTGTYSMEDTEDDQSSPVTFNDLDDRWYKVRGRRCIDSDRNECGTWSSWSTEKQVESGAPPPTNLALTVSGDNNLSLSYNRSNWTGHNTHHYQFEIQRSETASGTFEDYDEDNDSASPLVFNDVHTGYHYKARGRRCKSANTECGDWTDWSATPRLVPAKTYTPPTALSLTVPGDEDEMQASFTKSSVSSLSSHHYVIELHRADTSSGTFTNNDTESVTESPAEFDDIDRSKAYKARSKRCKTSSGKACGPWSAFSTTWVGPAPPTGISLSLTNPNTITATYTRSTSAGSSTHRYQFKLTRSETSGGTYTDYGNVVKTTSTVDFQTVHTGYYYKAVGRRCKTENADCGRWSMASAAVNVPTTSAPAPVLQTPTLANYDEVTVTFTLDNGPRAPPTQYPVVRLTQSTSSPGTHSAYVTDETVSRSPVVFTDVNTSRYYKARAKTCTDTAKKLCGAWSAATSALEVPAPIFPTLTAPTISRANNTSINATVTLPNESYGYLLTLHWSKDGKQYNALANPARLDHGDTSHTFTGLMPDSGGYYQAAISACVDDARKNCGSEVRSSVITLPTIEINPESEVRGISGGSLLVSATARNLMVGNSHRFRFSVSSTGGQLRFNGCEVATPVVSKEVLRDTSPSGESKSGDVRLHTCEGVESTLTVEVFSGTTKVASSDVAAYVLTQTEGVRVNGHGTSTNNQFVVRWDPVNGADSYTVRYAIAENSSGFLTTVARTDWTEVVHTSSKTEKTVTGLTAGKIYEVQVRASRNTVHAHWSVGAYVKPTSALPALTSTPKPKFAGIPMTKYWTQKTYSYEICSETFPTTTWVKEIEAAIALWPRYVKWVTDGSNIISTSGVSSDCGTSNCYDDHATDACVAIKELTSEHRIIRAHNQMHLIQACRLRMVGRTLACLVSQSPDGAVATTLMVFGSDDVKEDWGVDDNANSEDECSDLLDIALHEAGHAMGLGDVTEGANKLIDTAMRQATEGPCTPTGQDIGAMMTLYQSVP